MVAAIKSHTGVARWLDVSARFDYVQRDACEVRN